MADASQLADPLVDAREVLEAFRVYGLEVPEWRRRLTDAATALRPSAVDANSPQGQLAATFMILVRDGLSSHVDLVRGSADQVADLVDAIHIDGLPRPDDEYWGFD